MIKIDIPVVVEGKYDKIKLSNVVDGLIIETGGFRIFKDKPLRDFIKKHALGKGIIILTDSDRAGEKIRSYIKSFAGENAVIYNVYVPQIEGKERRKDKSSADGFLGVEGIRGELIENALKRFCNNKISDDMRKITPLMLAQTGFTGKENSSLRRKELLKRLELPVNLNTKSLIKALNTVYTFDEAERILKEEAEKWQ